MIDTPLRNLIGMSSLVLALTSACSNGGEGADPEASTEDTSGEMSTTDDGTGTPDGTDTSASTTSGSETSPAEGTDGSDTEDSGGTDDGTTGGTDSSGTGSGGPLDICDPAPGDDACISCTKSSCCDPLEACYEDAACACIADCIAASDDPGNALFECSSTCGAPPPVGLLLPIQECVSDSCEVCTGSAEETDGDTEDPIAPDLCEPVEGDGPCTSCTRDNCCGALEACAEDEGCACIVECVTAIDGTTEAEIFACATQCGVAPPANLLTPIGECRSASCEACTPEDPTDPTDPTGGGSICEILPDDDSCLGCTRENCCPQVEECFADPACACMANCVSVSGGDLSDAITACEQSCQLPDGGELLDGIGSCQATSCDVCPTE